MDARHQYGAQRGQAGDISVVTGVVGDGATFSNRGTQSSVGPDAAFQQYGDSMDLDFDLDSLAWATEFTYLASDGDSSAHQNQNLASGAGYPLDFLFFEDERTLPTFDNNRQVSDPSNNLHAIDVEESTFFYPATVSAGFDVTPHHASHPETSDEGATSKSLRNQLSLLAQGSCGDELVFRNCEPAKAVLLHGLAIEFGLGYTHDVWSQCVSISRLTTDPSSVFTQKSHPPTSSTSLEDIGPDQRPVSALPESSLGVSQEAPANSTAACAPDANGNRPEQLGAGGQLTRQPSRSQRISDSISKHVFTWKTSISKGGRRGPLSETSRRGMKAVEEVGGACWRCKVLRRKCDPGSSCRCCLQSVAVPQSGEDTPLWPVLGCRRGPLREAMPLQLLCPASRNETATNATDSTESIRSRHSLDMVDNCLLSAESQRLADMKAALECASYKLSIADKDMSNSFVTFIESGQYRNRESLHETYSHYGTTVTFADLIPSIAWELAENQGLMSLLEIRSWNGFMNMLQTACIYEAEVGRTPLVMISLICLRHCLEALRLNSANLLSSVEHGDCKPGHCHVQNIRDLSRSVATYVDELSSVIFNKENMRDRRWWLSTFYSLSIQSYVRHALIAIEKQLCFSATDDVPAEDLTTTQYLHVAAVLFTAASAKYDPLLGGRHQYVLAENSVIPETSVPKLHHSSARDVVEVERWPELGIKSSYQFLRRLLQIGSLDFESQQVDIPMADVSMPANTLEHSLDYSWPLFGAGTQSVTSLESKGSTPSRRFYGGHRHVNSIGSQYSMSTMPSVSLGSSESLARTLDTDITSIFESIYEQPLSPTKSLLADDGSNAIRKDTDVTNPSILSPTIQGPLVEQFGQVISNTAAANTPMLGPSTVDPVSLFCHCCPRNPRRFSTLEELTQHEAEKPHPCSRCKKRFKSPTEAERHVNAVHLKRDFWSCQALANPLDAYHSETFSGVVYDICGYCGGEFGRQSDDPPGIDVAGLVTHLESVHKHGECDRDKRFFRVDNYRSHLRIAHIASPGRWLKVLEKTCKMARDAEQA